MGVFLNFYYNYSFRRRFPCTRWRSRLLELRTMMYHGLMAVAMKFVYRQSVLVDCCKPFNRVTLLHVLVRVGTYTRTARTRHAYISARWRAARLSVFHETVKYSRLIGARYPTVARVSRPKTYGQCTVIIICL